MCNSLQFAILAIWVVATVLLTTFGGNHRKEYVPVILAGHFLGLLGSTTSGLIQYFGSNENKVFTDAASNFILVLSAAVGANYIAHAKMALDPERRWWI